jgi:tetratricopeptide (TPR) repeat protein
MAPRLLVERALALVPESDDFLALADVIIGTSRLDHEKMWARSGGYSTLSKRVVQMSEIREKIPAIIQRSAEHRQQLYGLIIDAIEAHQSGERVKGVQLLIGAGELEENEQRLDKAEAIYRLALEAAQDLRDKRPQILVLRLLGRVARNTARFDEAWSWYERSYHLAADEMDAVGQVNACQGLGSICGLRGQRAMERAWFDRGITLARGLDDSAVLWRLYISLSIPARQSGNLDEAERMLDKALPYIADGEAPSAKAYWYNSKGLILQERGDYGSAQRCYQEGLLGSPDAFTEIALHINLGHALLKQNRLFEAEECARKAEELAIRSHLVTDLVDIYDLLGELAQARGDEDGFVFYEQALEICRERALPDVKAAAIYYGYGRLHRSCGREKEGLAYLERARIIYAELGLIPELSRVLAELDTAASLSAAG